MSSSEAEQGALTAKDVAYIRKRDPTDYAIKDEREAEQDFLAPARWWFVTTLFPLIAGTFGPVATAFSICALVEPWRVVVAAGAKEQEGRSVPDPTWLIAVNATSLAVAISVNLAMLFQMVEKVPYVVAAPVVIVGWYISSFLLIGIVAAAQSHAELPAGESRTFSQAYYYAIMAAAIYWGVATMLTATAVGIFKGRFAVKFKLTTAQRTLMLQVIIFLGYWLAAAAVYARIESWSYLDSVYFTIVTLFTIGFGDYTSATHLGRGLLFPMAIGGILFVGLIIGSIRTLVLQGGSMKVSRRTLERARQRALASLDHDNNTMRVGLFRKHDAGGKNVTSEIALREQEFNLMQQIRNRTRRINQIIALGISAGAWLGLWLIGAVVFWRAEQGTGDWSYFEAVYFAYVSFLTVGYGDFEPDNQASKPAFVLWALIALPTLTVLIGAIGDNLAELINSVALKIAESTRLAGTTLHRGAVKSKKGAGSAHLPTKPPGFMEGHAGVDYSQFEDKAHADAAHALAVDFHHPKDASSDHPAHEEVKGHRAKARRFRGYLIFKAIQDVTTHIDASPARKYTYAEWCWFLKVLGEDENDPRNHRRLHLVKHEDEHHGPGTGIGQAGGQAGGNDGNGPVPWSWLGPRSPLLSSTDESRWLLEKLMGALEVEMFQKEKELERREQEDERGEKDGMMEPDSLGKERNNSEETTV